MMADALDIEARAQCRLADEYDAAQARGEVRKDGQRGKAVPDKNSSATTADLGPCRASRSTRHAGSATPNRFS
jgi:hypothetical protein